MLNYNGSSVEQYITLALISNDIVRNVITENTTGISKALGITTQIMPQLECCHPDLCLESPAAAEGSAFSRAVRHCTLRIPNLKKKGPKGLHFCTKKHSSKHKWQYSGVLAAWQIPQICRHALFRPLISWKPEDIAIKCKCRTSSEKIVEHVMSLFKLLVILMLTNLKYILVHNISSTNTAVLRDAYKNHGPQRKIKDIDIAQESL